MGTVTRVRAQAGQRMEMMEPRKNKVTGCFWGWEGDSWSWWGLERSVVSAGKAWAQWERG